MEVVFDTGSDWLTIDVEGCDSCTDNPYQFTDSTAFEYIGNPDYKFTITTAADGTEIKSLDLDTVDLLAYGSADLYGKKARDQVCLDPPSPSQQSDTETA